MPIPKSKRSNSVSFSQFRLIHLAAFRSLRFTLDSIDSTPADATFLAWAVQTALEDGRFADAVDLAKALSAQQYGDVRSFRIGQQLAALVTKVPFRDPRLDPTQKAVDAFVQIEAENAEVNRQLRTLCVAMGVSSQPLKSVEKGQPAAFPKFTIPEDESFIVSLLGRARGHLCRALGETVPWQDVVDRCRLGKGSSVGVRGDATHLLRKLSAPVWTVSRLAYPYVLTCAINHPVFWRALGLEKEMECIPSLYQDPIGSYTRLGLTDVFNKDAAMKRAVSEFRARFLARVQFVDADIITTVQKKADMDRTIGIQPLLNLLPQLGINDVLKEILLRQCNIDIREGQKKVNGKLALLGSWCTGTTLATLDLANASNSVTTMLVKLLFPQEWYDTLNCCRTPNYSLPNSPGEEKRYEMFAPMGNGFCFPVETLVFWSLIQAVYDVVEIPDRLCAVYGDDIIVYQPAALLLIELLNSVGFEVNIVKSFIHGPFRESCGQDFFNGVNVRPVVVDEIFEDWQQVYHFINSLQRKGFTTLAADLRQLVPVTHRFCRPYNGETRTALDVPLDEFMASPYARWDKDIQGWSWPEFVSASVADPEEYDGVNQLSVILHGATAENYKARGTFRRKTDVRVRRVPQQLTAKERTLLSV